MAYKDQFTPWQPSTMVFNPILELRWLTNIDRHTKLHYLRNWPLAVEACRTAIKKASNHGN